MEHGKFMDLNNQPIWVSNIMTLTQPELKELLKNIPMYNTIANHNPVDVTGQNKWKFFLCGKNCDVQQQSKDAKVKYIV